MAHSAGDDGPTRLRSSKLPAASHIRLILTQCKRTLGARGQAPSDQAGHIASVKIRKTANSVGVMKMAV